MRLLAVELRRLVARRMVLLVAVGALAAIGLAAAGAVTSVRPLSAAELAQAEAFYQQELERWEEDGDQIIEDCLEAEADERERIGDDVDFACEQQAPQREWFIPQEPSLRDDLPRLLSTVSMLLLLTAFVVGATSTAAEFSTGSMSSWLTFEPRRVRVYASKVAAAAVVAVPLTVVLLGLYLTVVWLGYTAYDLAAMPATAWAGATWTSLRLVLLAAVAAAAGAALGVLMRHTAAVLGALVGYAIVGEAMAASILPGLQPWLLMTNVRGWVEGGTTYWLQACRVEAGGTVCEMTDRALGLGQASVYLVVVTALVVVGSALVFRHRDVG